MSGKNVAAYTAGDSDTKGGVRRAYGSVCPGCLEADAIGSVSKTEWAC